MDPILTGMLLLEDSTPLTADCNIQDALGHKDHDSSDVPNMVSIYEVSDWKRDGTWDG